MSVDINAENHADLTTTWLITTWRHYEEALKRIADLAGCLEDTPEELELMELELEVAVWETKRHQMKVVFPTD